MRGAGFNIKKVDSWRYTWDIVQIEANLTALIQRMARETCYISFWTCLLQQIMYEHFKIITSVSILTQGQDLWCNNVKIYV